MSRRALALVFLQLIVGAKVAHAQIAVQNQGYIPYSDAPIFYRSNDISDPVTQLQKRLESGAAKLDFDSSSHGYLRSVLKQLDIPISSQTLVFSKTSFQYPKISPEHPRALYFNDDVYVGVVHEGKEVEVVSFDAQQGAMFFILHEAKAAEPRFQRAELDCTQCHIAAGTRGVPGVLMKSVRTRENGTPLPGVRQFITDQGSKFSDRFGGWYVSGALAGKTLANLAAPAGATQGDLQPLKQLYSPAESLAPGSDEVALLVLAHQTQMHNLITLTNYKTRIALHEHGGDAAAEEVRDAFERPAEQLLRYLVFAGETPLPALEQGRVGEGSIYAREFAARGPRDSRGRSLRDFDLGTRLFRYPLSYLVYTEAFDGLPEPAKGHVYRRLLEVLSGEDESPEFASLPAEERRAAIEILLETKPGLPREWQEYARTHHLRAVSAKERKKP